MLRRTCIQYTNCCVHSFFLALAPRSYFQLRRKPSGPFTARRNSGALLTMGGYEFLQILTGVRYVLPQDR
jgi:hypothetical protein